MEDFFTLLVAGVSVGSIYGLIGIGLNATFLTTKTLNFGHGSLMMLSASLCAVLIGGGIIPPISVLLALASVALLMVFVEVLAVRPAMAIEGNHGWTVSTLGVGIVLQGVAVIWFGQQAMAFPDIIFNVSDSINIAGVSLGMQNLAVLVLAIACTLLIEIFVRKTVWGRAFRAVSMDADLARVNGIPVRTIVLSSFAISGLLAGMAGILVAQINGTVDPAFGFNLVILGFIASVIGGIGNFPGALVGGILIGVLEQVVGGYISTAAQHGIAFALLIIMLICRPDGIFGEREIKKV